MDTAEDEKYWKIVISGKPGTGKTSMGVSAPNPLILLSERQGMPHIKQAAKRQGKATPPTLYMESVNDYKSVLRVLMGGRQKDFEVTDLVTGEVVLSVKDWWPDSLVLDSLTEALSIIFREIKEQAPSEKGKDGLPKSNMRLWGVQVERGTNFIKMFRDLPMHVFFLCLRDEQQKNDSDGNLLERSVAPSVTPRSLVPVLAAAVNVIGYSYRTLNRKTRRPEYGAVLEAGEDAITKPCHPLRAVEVPDLGSWIARLSGALDAAPEAPEAPGDMAGGDEPEPLQGPAGSGNGHAAAEQEQREPEATPPPTAERKIDNALGEAPKRAVAPRKRA